MTSVMMSYGTISKRMSHESESTGVMGVSARKRNESSKKRKVKRVQIVTLPMPRYLQSIDGF